MNQIGALRFVARFDIAAYYYSMPHRVLLDLLAQAGVDTPLRAVVPQYLEAPDPNRTGRGMTAAEALSPLLGALYLLPLDNAMERLIVEKRIHYLRYIDDMVIPAKTRRHLRTAIRELIRETLSLGLRLHRDKRFFGRVDSGIDFLGYRIHPSCKLPPSAESLQRLATRARRFYEQGAGNSRLRRYVTRWAGWLRGGLDGHVSRKGGVKRFIVFVLKQLRVSGVSFSRMRGRHRSPTGVGRQNILNAIILSGTHFPGVSASTTATFNSLVASLPRRAATMPPLLRRAATIRPHSLCQLLKRQRAARGFWRENNVKHFICVLDYPHL
jgi:RNA-directed DNA polymerase